MIYFFLNQKLEFGGVLKNFVVQKSLDQEFITYLTTHQTLTNSKTKEICVYQTV